MLNEKNISVLVVIVGQAWTSSYRSCVLFVSTYSAVVVLLALDLACTFFRKEGLKRALRTSQKF